MQQALQKKAFQGPTIHYWSHVSSSSFYGKYWRALGLTSTLCRSRMIQGREKKKKRDRISEPYLRGMARPTVWLLRCKTKLGQYCGCPDSSAGPTRAWSGLNNSVHILLSSGAWKMAGSVSPNAYLSCFPEWWLLPGSSHDLAFL